MLIIRSVLITICYSDPFDLSGFIHNLRVIKSKSEIHIMKSSAMIAAKAMIEVHYKWILVDSK